MWQTISLFARLDVPAPCRGIVDTLTTADNSCADTRQRDMTVPSLVSDKPLNLCTLFNVPQSNGLIHAAGQYASVSRRHREIAVPIRTQSLALLFDHG